MLEFVSEARTKKPIFSGGGNVGFARLVLLKDYEAVRKELEAHEQEGLIIYGRKIEILNSTIKSRDAEIAELKNKIIEASRIGEGRGRFDV